jgi:hypothetical protein
MGILRQPLRRALYSARIPGKERLGIKRRLVDEAERQQRRDDNQKGTKTNVEVAHPQRLARKFQPAIHKSRTEHCAAEMADQTKYGLRSHW